MPLLLPIFGSTRKTGNWTPCLRTIAALAVWLLSVGMLLTKAVRSRKVLAVSPPS